MAKDLVRIRRAQTKFTNLTAQLRQLSLQMTVCIFLLVHSFLYPVMLSSSLLRVLYVVCRCVVVGDGFAASAARINAKYHTHM